MSIIYIKKPLNDSSKSRNPTYKENERNYIWEKRINNKILISSLTVAFCKVEAGPASGIRDRRPPLPGCVTEHLWNVNSDITSVPTLSGLYLGLNKIMNGPFLVHCLALGKQGQNKYFDNDAEDRENHKKWSKVLFGTLQWKVSLKGLRWVCRKYSEWTELCHEAGALGL